MSFFAKLSPGTDWVFGRSSVWAHAKLNPDSFCKAQVKLRVGFVVSYFSAHCIYGTQGFIFSMFWFEMFTVITLERLGVSADSFYNGLGK